MEAAAVEVDAYRAPPVFKFVARLVTGLRSDYSNDIALYVADDFSTEATDYRGGLVFLACLVASFAFLWAFVLVVLKIKGPAVGCASGRAFERDTGSSDMQPGASTDVESDESGDNEESSNQQTTEVLETDDLSMQSSIPSVESECFPREDESCYSDESEAAKPSRRERRTQFCFLVFGVIALLCVPMILIFSFAPLRQTTDNAGQYLDMAFHDVTQVQTSVAAVKLALNASEDAASRMPVDLSYSALCPGIPPENISSSIQDVVELFSEVYQSMQQRVSGNITEISDVLNEVEHISDTAEIYYTKTDRYLWLIVPLLLLLAAIVAVAMFGVVQAWRGESTEKLQRSLSYFVLPVLVIFTLGCWVVAAALIMTAAAESDACLYGSVQTGSPGALIEAVTQYSGLGADNTASEFIQAYTDGCVNGDPTQGLTELETEIRTLLSYIQSELSQVDAIGRENLALMCGNEGLNDFYAGISDQGELLDVAGKAIATTTEVLSCANIYPMYVQLIEKSFCSDTAGATAAAFILFLLLGVSTLGMISLRASWTQPIREQKIFEEEEVAENMIVDEHEEYLAYISRYKHEWQEYRGFDSAMPCDPDLKCMDNDSSHSQGTTGDRTDPNSSHNETEVGSNHSEIHEAFDPYSAGSWDNRSLSTTGDVSFLSLCSRTGAHDIGLPTLAPLLVPSDSADDGETELLPQGPLATANSRLVIIGFGLQTGDQIGSIPSESLPEESIEVTTHAALKRGGFDCEPTAASPKQESDLLLNEALPPSSPPKEASHFFPCSPYSSSPAASSECVVPEKKESKGEDREGHAMITISSPPSTPSRAVAIPPSAVHKLSQQRSPRVMALSGLSVRRASPGGALARHGGADAPGTPRHRGDCSPSSFSRGPLVVDQYPQAYEVALDDTGVSELHSPLSAARSEQSNSSAEQD